MTGGLEGVRVLDLAVGKALVAGSMLARLGADVIVTEPAVGSPDRAERDGFLWTALCAGKRGITCDPATPEGQGLLARLAGWADIVITGGSFCPQDSGTDWDALRRQNPRLIHAAITPFGEDGPKADYAASDLVVWASGGPVFPCRDGERPPLRISSDQAMLHAGADAAVGALVALAARDKTGLGQKVTVSAQESAMLATLSSVLAVEVGHDGYTMVQVGPKPAPGKKKQLDLSGSGSRTRRSKWVVKDGVVEMHLAMGPAAGRFTNSLFAWLASIGACDARIAGWDWIKQVPADLMAGTLTDDDMEEARAVVAAAFAGLTKDEILAATMEWRLILAPVMTIADLAHSAHLEARKAFAQVQEGGETRVVPAAITGHPERLPLRGAPLVGEHDAEVLAQLAALEPARVAVPATPANAAGLPLAGLKVVDLAWVVAGPMVGRMLADCGAEVVRIESSTRIETARMMGPFPGGTFDPQRCGLYDNCNAGKLGLSLDLSRSEAREIVLDMAAWGDVLVESFAAGQMERWGLGWEALKARNPRLIMVSTTIMGQTGPLVGLAGYGNIGAALSGFQALVGYPDGNAIGPFGPYTDFVGPRYTTAALLAALAERERTGEGAWLDISQGEAGIQFLGPEFADYFATGRIAGREGNRVADMAPHGVFRAAGADRWVAIAVHGDAEWARLAGMIGGAARETRFATLAGRKAAEDELEALVGAWTAPRDPLAIEQALQAEGIAAHVVAEARDISADPQLRHLGHFVRLPHPHGGDSVVEQSRFRLSGAPIGPRLCAPTFGRDNGHVLGTMLGYADARIAALAEAGVLT